MSLAVNASSIIAAIIVASPSGQNITALAYNTAALSIFCRAANASAFTEYGVAGTSMVSATAGTYTSAGFAKPLNASGIVVIEFHVPSTHVVAGVPIEIVVMFNSEQIGAWREVPNLPSVTSGGAVTLAAASVQAIWDALTSALTTANSIGKRLADYITGDAFVRLGAPSGASISADIQTRMATFSLPANFSALSITGGGTVTAGTVSDKTGYTLSGTQTFNNTGTWTGNLSGSVGSVTGNVGGNVTGSVGSISGITFPAGFSTLTVAAIQSGLSTLTAAGVRSELATELARIDVATSTRMATFTYTAPDNAGISTILAGVIVLADRLTSDRATALDNLDAAISTRLASGSYTAPDNAGIAAIQAKSDQLTSFDFVTAGTRVLAMLELDGSVYRFTANALEQAPAGGGGGGGATAAQIWAYATRTLTSFPPTMQAATPQPGVGLFLPGARLEGGPVSYRGSSLAGSTISLRARVVGTDGDWIQRADVSAVESIVVNLQDSTDTDSDTHTVADVVFDALQADGTWTEDSVGYNVAVDIDGDRLPAAGTAYRVTLTLTTTAGPIKTVWEIQTTAS